MSSLPNLRLNITNKIAAKSVKSYYDIIRIKSKQNKTDKETFEYRILSNVGLC